MEKMIMPSLKLGTKRGQECIFAKSVSIQKSYYSKLVILYEDETASIKIPLKLLWGNTPKLMKDSKTSFSFEILFYSFFLKTFVVELKLFFNVLILK